MLRATATLLVLIAGSASAGWTAFTLPFAPQEVNTWSPGEWTAHGATTEGAFLFSDTAQQAGLMGLVARGTALTREGCLAALDENGDLNFACPSGTSPSQSLWFFGGALALKGVPDAGAFALQNTGADINVCYSSQGAEPLSVPVCSAVFGLVPSDVLAAHRSGTLDYAAFGREGNSLVFVSTESPSLAQTQITTTGRVEALELFGEGGKISALYSTVDAGMFAVDFTGTPTPAGVALPSTLSRVSGISFSVGTGELTSGDGFGVAIGHGTSHQLLSAVPALTEAEYGRTWIPSTAPPSVDLSGFTRVDCVAGSFCVAVRPVSGMPNVLLYENQSPPMLTLSSSAAQVQPGAMLSVGAEANDADGDAVRTTWRQTGGLAVDFTADGGLLEIDTTALPMCQSGTTTFEARATDGLSSHLQTAGFSLQVSPVLPSAPVVSPASAVIEAGSPVLTLNAGPDSAWTPRAGAQAVSVDGGVAYFEPTETLCAAQVHEYDVRAVGTCGESPPTSVQVTVSPFGRPLEPFPTATSFAVDAGTTLRLAPEAKHLCASAPVTTTWEVQGGLPPGMQLLKDDGASGTGAFESAFVDLVSEACSAITPQRIELVATNRTVGSVSTPRSSTLAIDVATHLLPFEGATLSLGPPAQVGGEARGSIEVGGLNCAEARGLTAQLNLLRAADGAVLATTSVPVPGPYSIALPNACEAGDFRLVAQLFDSSGTSGASSELSFSTERLDAAVGEASASSLEVTCGGGLGARVSVAEVEGACNSGTISWTQLAGPPLVTASLTGREVELVSANPDLSGLIGQTVSMRVTMEAADGNVASRDVSFLLTAQPFLTVEHLPTRPVTEDSEQVQVVVRITNPTPCGLLNVNLLQFVEGLTPNTASIHPRELTLTPAADAWSIGGVAIGGRSTRTVSYLARPSLLGEPRVRGQAYLNGIPLSPVGALANEAGASGCGCAGAGATSLPWALLAALAFLRKKRRVKSSTADITI